MTHYKFEYVWLDGWAPTSHIRSKTAIREMDTFDGNVESLPEWSFDGSSTMQAEGHFSDCILKPVRLYNDPARENGFIVLCEVFDADHSPNFANARPTVCFSLLVIFLSRATEKSMVSMSVDRKRSLSSREVGTPSCFADEHLARPLAMASFVSCDVNPAFSPS